MDSDLIPFDWSSDAHERKCPTCGAEPGQCCSSPEPDRPGFAEEHGRLIHYSRE